MDQQGSLWTLQFTGEATKAQRREDAWPQLQRRSGAGAHSWLWRRRGGQGGTPAVGLSRGLPGSGSWLQPLLWQQRVVAPTLLSGPSLKERNPGSQSLDVVHPFLELTKTSPTAGWGQGEGSGALVWTLASGCLPYLTASPVHCDLERSLPAPKSQTPLSAWGII